MQPKFTFLKSPKEINEAGDLDWNGLKHRAFNVADNQVLSGGTHYLNPKPQRTFTMNFLSRMNNSSKKKREIFNCKRTTAKISDFGIIRWRMLEEIKNAEECL